MRLVLINTIIVVQTLLKVVVILGCLLSASLEWNHCHRDYKHEQAEGTQIWVDEVVRNPESQHGDICLITRLHIEECAFVKDSGAFS